MDAFVRYYDPVAGRFLSTDPVLTDSNSGASFNRYTYALNNPYKYIDPDGRLPFLVPVAIFLLKEAAAEVASHYTGGASDFLSVRRSAQNVGGFALKKMAHAVDGAVADLAKHKADDVAKNIDISRAKYGEAAEHIADAQKAGHPDVLTIARDGADPNRKASIGGIPKVAGKQLDEYPPAMMKEGGAGASVRAINPSNNMGAGACIGNACRGLNNGEKVRIRVVD